MNTTELADEIFESWYSKLKRYKGFPARGTLAGAMTVLERLKNDFDLDLRHHTAKGGSQVIGAGPSGLGKLLARYGEIRPFLREGGRTNRGLRGEIGLLLRELESSGVTALKEADRFEVLEAGQRFLVERVREIHGRERIKAVYDPSRTTADFVTTILIAAREDGKDGPVAQHLVGAKLQLRFPKLAISNESYSTADQQLGRAGDFTVGDTAFHVTVAPSPAVYEKCAANLAVGMRVYLLVPARKLEGAKQIAADIAEGRISVVSIEDFVAQNIDEISGFSRNQDKHQRRALLETYNMRVAEAETDTSLLIELPPNL